MAFRKLNSTLMNTLTRSLIQSSALNRQTFAMTLTRFYSSQPGIATYEEIKKVPGNSKVLLIDVREPQELVDTGIVPASINIPLGKVKDYLSNLSDEEFKKLYQRSKPTSDMELIFMCKIGVRSQKATDIAKSIGFSKARNYLGSWQEWSEKEGINK